MADKLAQDIEAVPTEAGNAVAVLFTGDRFQLLVGLQAHTQATGVSQDYQAHELTQPVRQRKWLPHILKPRHFKF